ncbi:MAG: SGNH/GDSL hydrolase family protein [Candidatus Pacearchaeota archaeon]
MKRIKKKFILGILIFILICLLTEIKLKENFYSKYNLIEKRMNEIKIESLYIKSENKELLYELNPNILPSNYNKKEEVYRIIIIGDSIARGQGLDKELNSSFGKLLETKLNLNKENKIYEVIILAISGYSTSQEIILLEKEALKYKPDLILWSYVLNDPANPKYHDGNGELGFYFNRPKIFIIEEIEKRLFLFNEKRIINEKKCDKEYHKLIHCVYWNNLKKNIKRIADISKKEKIEIIFLIHPVFEEDNDFPNYSLKNLHEEIKKEMKENNLLVLDILDIYKDHTKIEIRINNKDPWHPNEKGHEIIADYIYSFLNKEYKLF